MTVKQAYEETAKLIPGSFCIGLDLWRHHHSIDNSFKVDIMWDIYVSENSGRFEGETLEKAVAKLRESLQPTPTSSIETVVEETRELV